MAYDPHFKVVLIGDLHHTPILEQWTTSFRFDGVDATDYSQATADAAADAVKTAASTWITASAMEFSDATWLTEARIYRIGTDGLSYGVIGYGTTPDDVQGATTSNRHPYQVSNVISLVAAGRAPGVRGRMYLPPQGAGVDSSSHITESEAGNFVVGTRTLANAVSTALEALTAASPQLCIASGVGAGTLKPVTEMRCGRVPDTHRSRRRSLDELYVSVTYPS